MAPQLEALERLVRDAIRGALPDRVSRVGVILSPTDTQNIKKLLGEIDAQRSREFNSMA